MKRVSAENKILAVKGEFRYLVDKEQIKFISKITEDSKHQSVERISEQGKIVLMEFSHKLFSNQTRILR
jgi:hypothetical protein